jgi:replicative DNA helicase
VSAAPDHEATIRAWFDADGWRLEADELGAALTERGADDELVIELRDEGADRRRRLPAETGARKGTPNGTNSGANTGKALQTTGARETETGTSLAPVVPITEAPSHGTVPPQNLEAEESVLGAMMISPGAISSCSEILDASGSEFYRESHARIWRAALALDAAGEPVDAITLADALEQTGELESVGGKVRLHELAGLVPASANAAHYARIVRDMAKLRGLIRAGGEISRLGWERPGEASELVDRASQIVYDLGAGTDPSGLEQGKDLVMPVFKRITDLYESGSGMIGTPTGFRDLDRLTCGLEPGNLIIVGARPSVGKSALAICIGKHVAIGLGQTVAMFTVEMSKGEVTQRMLSLVSKVDGQKIRSGRLNAEDMPKVVNAASVLARAPFYVKDHDITLPSIRAHARRLKEKHGLALIIVDYLQLMSVDGAENATQEVTKISRGLKLIARDLEVPVMALSQLNRKLEDRLDKRPQLSDLRQSGSIEQDADVVIFLHRDKDNNDAVSEAELILAKQRNGPTDDFKVSFVKKYAAFTDQEHTPGVF